jgi:fumarylacetoacetate (FAA) hydrolase
MKLGSLDSGRDGALVVVRRDLGAMCKASSVAPTMQAALDNWADAEPKLRELADALEKDQIPSERFDPSKMASPLPRAYEWVDGSAYLNHVILVRKARGAEPPETLRTDPLVYQGGSSTFLCPTEDLVLHDPAWGLDFESEVCVILGDVALGTAPASAVKLVCLANDITLRNLVPNELGKGFGFFQSKPSTAFSPVAVTPDELGPAWREGRLHLRLSSTLNGERVGDTEAGPEMHFSFYDLLKHITRTRGFSAGTVLGSGTVSNADRARGISCLAERRMIEIIETGAAKTPFMKIGDTIEIEMRGPDGRSLFGAIRQRVVAPSTGAKG